VEWAGHSAGDPLIAFFAEEVLTATMLLTTIARAHPDFLNCLVTTIAHLHFILPLLIGRGFKLSLESPTNPQGSEVLNRRSNPIELCRTINVVLLLPGSVFLSVGGNRFLSLVGSEVYCRLKFFQEFGIDFQDHCTLDDVHFISPFVGDQRIRTLARIP
jgi:hypothetical protein